MSRYGSPGVPYGAHPGQPGPSGEPPEDPWGRGHGNGAWEYGYDPGGYDPTYGDPMYSDPGYGDPTYGDPGYGDPGYGPDWDSPPEQDRPPRYAPPPERRGNNPLLFVAVTVLVVVVAGAVAYALYLLSGEEEDQPAAQDPAPGATGAPPAPTDPDSTQNNIGLNAAMARVGDCLVNLSTSFDPQLQIVPCDSDESGAVYEVLERFDVHVEGETRSEQDESARETCEHEDYTIHYFEVPIEPQGEGPAFLLCMLELQPAPEDEEEEE